MFKGLDPVLRLLMMAILLFTAIILATDRIFPGDGQTFQLLSGILTGFVGAFLGRIKPQHTPGTPDDDAQIKSASWQTTTTSSVVVPPEPKP